MMCIANAWNVPLQEITVFCFSEFFSYAMVTCEIELVWVFEIISVFYFTRSHTWNWNKIITAAEIISAMLNMLENTRKLQ